MTRLLCRKVTLVIDSVSKNDQADIPELISLDAMTDAQNANVDSVPESILTAALEQVTNSSWRLGCASIGSGVTTSRADFLSFFRRCWMKV